MTYKDLVFRITYFRDKANLSARELSLRIGKNKGYINKLESTYFALPTEVLLKIIEELGVTIEEFFCLGESYTKEGKDLLQKYNKLSQSNKDTINDLINKLQ